MSQNVLEMMLEFNEMNSSMQLILQCAPCIAGLKPSNLLCVQDQDAPKVVKILHNAGLACQMMHTINGKTTFLVFDREALWVCLNQPEIRLLLRKWGYVNASLDEIITENQVRYSGSVIYGEKFPHEMGLILGYPVEDVVGFMEHQGKEPLLVGYWKVYGNVAQKKKLFRLYEMAEEQMMQQLRFGIPIEDIIRSYRSRMEEKAV